MDDEWSDLFNTIEIILDEQMSTLPSPKRGRGGGGGVVSQCFIFRRKL